jgi:RNA-directed DNA polymerase
VVKSEQATRAAQCPVIWRPFKAASEHRQKPRGQAQGCKFLGFAHKVAFNGMPKHSEKFRVRVRELTNRSGGIHEIPIRSMNMYAGWINYYCIASGYQHCVELDSWIRRRIRMCYWQQWRNPVTRICNLIKRGVPEDLAVKCGASQKGQWHSSKTKGIQLALSNDYLKAQGLYELRHGWITLHH